jgi:predicted CoA-binding protein
MPDCEFPKTNATADEIADILRATKIIAVVGLSPKPERPSHSVSAYMKDQGYTIIPVNPGQAEILGEKAYASVTEIPGPIDMVNIFREPSAVPEIVDQAIAKGAKVVWMQEGIVHNEAADKARAAGLQVVMNKCLYKEHCQL